MPSKQNNSWKKDCGVRPWCVCWVGILLWLSFFFLTHLHLEDPAGDAEASIAAEKWRRRVSDLDADVKKLRHEVADRDATISELRGTASTDRRDRGGGSGGESGESAVAAAAAEFTGDRSSPLKRDDGNASPASRGGGGLLGDMLKPWAAEHTRSEHEAARGGGDAGTRCSFEEGLDYPGDEEDVVENSSPDGCCDLCLARNKKRPGACSVAVLSSPTDAPPLACWLKKGVHRATRKAGVKACWPPDHGPIPKAPELGAAEREAREAESNRAENLQVLASLPAFSGTAADVDTLRSRAEQIRGAMRHAWSNYKKFAWGQDDLKPISGRGSDGSFRHAVTMVDSLDTLWLMGMKAEFEEAKGWLTANLPGRFKSLNQGASVFETTIRSFGGLLSAYDLSQDRTFIDLAIPLARRINDLVSRDGVTPYTFGGRQGGMGCPSLAESGTIQLEMRYLAHVTGDSSYASKVDKFYETVKRSSSVDGLWPNCWRSGKGKITMGADGDSFYEYLPKAWLQGGKKDKNLWDMYDATVKGIEKRLIKQGKDGLTYVGNFFWSGGDQGRYEEEMEHLTCFLPGFLMLGAADHPDPKRRTVHAELAEKIATTCYQMYDQQPTKIGPERVKMMKMDLSRTDTREYILRPEAAEGWWYMREFTEDPKYREWGWNTFQAFEKWLWVPHGYASLKDVRATDKKYLDRMESFFLAETLKYLFLLQDPDHQVQLDKYVFNTEAHPLSILSRAPVLPQ